MELYESARLNTIYTLGIVLPLINTIGVQTFKYVLEHFVDITSVSTINARESRIYLIMTITLHIYKTI